MDVVESNSISVSSEAEAANRAVGSIGMGLREGAAKGRPAGIESAASANQSENLGATGIDAGLSLEQFSPGWPTAEGNQEKELALAGVATSASDESA